MPTAVVVDGAYFLRRFKHRYPHLDANSPKDVAFGVLWLAAAHVAVRSTADPMKLLGMDGGAIRTFDMRWTESADLYRIFFYDCPPLAKRIHLPISKRSLDLARTETAVARFAIHRELANVRKIALRLGRLNDKFGWRPKPDSVDRWLGAEKFEPTDDDFELDTVQKGVDMRLGLDVASMAFKKQIDQLILVAGDADFVPAAKLARREGIDVVLDPMGGSPPRDLVEHVDGVRDIPRIVR